MTDHNTNQDKDGGQDLTIDRSINQFLSTGIPFRTLESTYGPGHRCDEESGAVTDIVTHCARIYMCGGFAIKVKRPVSYSYLDMTDLKDRYKFLQRELQINQPHLPDVYLALCALVLNEGGQLQLIVDTTDIESDTVQEWCLVMRRFDQSNILDNIAQSGELSNETIVALGNSIARYHKAVTTVPVDDGDARILEIIEELRHEFGKLGDLLPAELTHEFCQQGLKRFNQVAGTLRQRGKDGFIRQCHGDLHLRNIVIHDGEPVPFDALEFDERLRTIDTLYDLAFVLMDLDHRSLAEQENLLLNEYLLRTPASNIQAMDTLPLFMFCRAGIKAMTTAQSAKEQSATEQSATNNAENRRALLQEARDYLQKGINYLHDRRAVVVAIGGFSGSGKSTVARELPNLLCAAPGAILLRSDAERKAEFGVAETYDLGLDHYSQENSRRTYERVLEKTESAARAGYPVIVDATFLDVEQRQEIAAVATRTGVEFFGFWLSAPVEVMRRRIEGRQNDASDAGVEILDLQLEKYRAAEEWSAIDTTDPVSVSATNIANHVVR